jgi:hypothetical protein
MFVAIFFIFYIFENLQNYLNLEELYRQVRTSQILHKIFAQIYCKYKMSPATQAPTKWSFVADWFRGLCGSRENQKASETSTRRRNSSECYSSAISAKEIEQHQLEKQNEWKKEIGSVAIATVVEGVKVAMATLLSVFVPQFCDRVPPLEPGTCTLVENFSDLSQFNSFVIAWNFITLGLFIKLTMVINKREAYFIKHLDASKEHSAHSFEKNCASRPRIILRVKDHNKALSNYTKWLLGFFSLNIVFSCILIFYYFYDGFRSVTTLLANVLLVANKLYSLHELCQECNGSPALALSSVKQEAISYNILDAAYAPPRKFRRNTIESLAPIEEVNSSKERDSPSSVPSSTQCSQENIELTEAVESIKIDVEK